MFDPGLTWRSIKTEHFWVHYHQGLEQEAFRYALMAEHTHRWLAPPNRWSPFFRTDVVLVDSTDFANGFSTPVPFNRLQLYITRPELDSVLSNFDDWRDLLFTHEYTHTLNLDQVTGIPALTRYSLGRVCFPNIFLPAWMIEGHPVYYESRREPFGRNNSTYTDMIMRCEYSGSSFKSISEASHFPRRWPAGNVPYLYGGLFVDFLEKKYGKTNFAAVLEENSDNILPFLVNMNAGDVYGESFLELWREWEDFLRVYYTRQTDRIKSAGTTDFREITDSGYRTSLPRFSGDGRYIYYVQNTPFEQPGLMRYDVREGTRARLCDVHDPNFLSVAGDGAVFLSDAEYYRSFSIYNEAYRYERRRTRLTGGLRGSYIDVAADGTRSVFVRQEGGMYSIALSDPGFQSIRHLIDRSPVQLAFPRFSPDGGRLVFSIRDSAGYTDLVLWDPQSASFTRLMNDRYNDITPSWHPDGRRVLFSSDRGGVYNLYAIDLGNGTVSRLTNLTGGAFSPAVSPDGASIAFASYSASGFNIALMPYPSGPLGVETLGASRIPPGFFSPMGVGEGPPGEIPTRPYSVWRSIFPPYWLPVFGSEEITDGRYDSLFGVYLPGIDTLYHHFYSARLYAYNLQKRAVLELDYMLSRFYPNLMFSYKDESLFYGSDDFPWDEHPREQVKRTLSRSGAAGLDVPFLYFLSSHRLMLAYKYEESTTDVYDVSSGATDRHTDLLARLRAGYIYTGSRTYPYSISGEDGRDFYIISDIYNRALGSDISYSKSRAEYAEYLPGVARNHVLMARLRGGVAINNPDYLAPYPLGRFEKGETGAPASEEDQMGLRGYPAGAFYGSRLAVGTLEYRLPVLQKDAGRGTLPLLFRDLWLAAFMEYGNVWDGGVEMADFRTSAGLETHARVTLGYYLDVEGYVGIARGFSRDGELQVYFGLGTVLEGAFKNYSRPFKHL